MSKEIITRKQAKELGLKKYFTGKPCKHGHSSIRDTSNGTCNACAVEYQSNNKEHIQQQVKENGKKYRKTHKDKISRDAVQYYKDNKERISQRNKEFYIKNKARLDEQGQLYRETNRDKINQYYKDNKELYIKYRDDNQEAIKQSNQEYNKNNRDKLIAHRAKRRFSKKQATPKWYKHKEVLNIYTHCVELNNLWGTKFQVDHIIPLQSDTVCGLHCWDNLQLLEGQVNSSKSNNYVQDW